MKTTFYELSEATRQAWGNDPYAYDLDDFIFEDTMEGSIANNETGDVIEFNLLSKKYTNGRGLDDWDIEITNIDEFPEIKELL